MLDRYVYELVRCRHSHRKHRLEFVQRIRCSTRTGIGTATFRKPRRTGWRNADCHSCRVESRLHLSYISFHFSFQLYGTLEFSSFVSCAPPVLPHRESGDENVSWRHYVATYKKKYPTPQLL